jgi:hypothetical protein
MVQGSTNAAFIADKVTAGTVLAAETVAKAASIATAVAINLMGQAFAFKPKGAGVTEPTTPHELAPPMRGAFFESVLQRPVLWRAVADNYGNVALERRLRPRARELEQRSFLFFGLGLAGPKQGLLGVLPELIGF